MLAVAKVWSLKCVCVLFPNLEKQSDQEMFLHIGIEEWFERLQAVSGTSDLCSPEATWRIYM